MPGRQRQFDDAVRIRIPNFAVGTRKPQWIMAPSTGAHNNFANPIHWVGVPVRILRRKAFVGMLMTHYDQCSVRRIEILPEFLQFQMNRMTLEHAAAEKRMMAVSQDAGIRMLREVFPQPRFLRRSRTASAQILSPAIRIQRHDMPRTKVVTVI